MKSKTYIEKKISELILMFPKIKCIYEFDEIDNTHSIYLNPIGIYEIYNNLYEIECQIYEEFSILFPNEGIYIIEDHEYSNIENPSITKYGSEFLSYLDENKFNYEVNNQFNIIKDYLTTIKQIPFKNKSTSPNKFDSEYYPEAA